MWWCVASAAMRANTSAAARGIMPIASGWMLLSVYVLPAQGGYFWGLRVLDPKTLNGGHQGTISLSDALWRRSYSCTQPHGRCRLPCPLHAAQGITGGPWAEPAPARHRLRCQSVPLYLKRSKSHPMHAALPRQMACQEEEGAAPWAPAPVWPYAMTVPL